jgi:uncharacterized protein
MAGDAATRPLIWVLKGLRAGDTAQAMALALQIGGRVEGKQLAFNASHALPNWLLGARVAHLTEAAQSQLRPPWPDLVVATGKRTAPVALWIKRQSKGKSRIVHLGRPRMALNAFDLLVTTPQYGLPQLDNVVRLPLPFATAKQVDDATLNSFRSMWSDLPNPHILAVIGGHKFPQRLGVVELQQFAQALNRRASALNGSIVLLDSPRSPAGALQIVANTLTVAHWIYDRGRTGNPYQAGLALCDEMVVTSDSVSMVTEMLSTAKPTWIFRLPVSALTPHWKALSGLSHRLSAMGIFSPPRDVDGLMQSLLDQCLIGDLEVGMAPSNRNGFLDAHQRVVQRIKALLAV